MDERERDFDLLVTKKLIWKILTPPPDPFYCGIKLYEHLFIPRLYACFVAEGSATVSVLKVL